VSQLTGEAAPQSLTAPLAAVVPMPWI
jgi:hypothetical protein